MPFGTCSKSDNQILQPISKYSIAEESTCLLPLLLHRLIHLKHFSPGFTYHNTSSLSFASRANFPFRLPSCTLAICSGVRFLPRLPCLVFSTDSGVRLYPKWDILSLSIVS